MPCCAVRKACGGHDCLVGLVCGCVRQARDKIVTKMQIFINFIIVSCSCFENHKQLHKTLYTYIFHEMLALNVKNMTRGNENRWMDCRQNLRNRSNWQWIGALGDPWRLDLVPLGSFGRCFAFTGPRPLPTSVRDPDPNSGRVSIRFAKVHILEVSAKSQISHKTHMILPQCDLQNFRCQIQRNLFISFYYCSLIRQSLE